MKYFYTLVLFSVLLGLSIFMGKTKGGMIARVKTQHKVTIQKNRLPTSETNPTPLLPDYRATNVVAQLPVPYWVYTTAKTNKNPSIYLTTCKSINNEKKSNITTKGKFQHVARQIQWVETGLGFINTAPGSAESFLSYAAIDKVYNSFTKTMDS